MLKEGPNLTPKTRLVVEYTSEISVAEQDVLERLYLPLIGPIAYSLYGALKGLMNTAKNAYRYHDHSELLSVLGVDLPSVLKARYKLEATGLLRTYFNTQGDTNRYIYKLQAPVSAIDFFSDDLLSVLLLDVIGENKYRLLADDFMPNINQYDLSNEITANILDVFHFDPEKLFNTPDEITDVRRTIPSQNSQVLHLLTDESYDWKFLGQFLNGYAVDVDEVSKNRQLIINESRIYGIDELEMGKLIASVAHLTDGKFNPQDLRMAIAKKYRSDVTVMSSEERKQLNEDVKEKERRTAKVAQKRSKNEKALFKIVNEMSPNDFLTQMKTQKGGNVTDGERWVLRSAIQKTRLPNSVVNMLIYHILVDENMSTLNKALFETIADDWQQSKLVTPEMVVEHINERKNKKAVKVSRRRNSRVTRKEIIPEWAKRAAENKPPKIKRQLTEDQKKKLAEQIRNMDDE